MRTLPLKFGCYFLLVLVSSFSIFAQAAGAEHRNVEPEPSVIRTILDPHNGMRWQLERGLEYPGGPGRMVLLKDRANSPTDLAVNSIERSKAHPITFEPVIRSGDKLVIEEHSAFVEARLEAVALGTAVEGAEFNARLAIGGKLVRAVAVAPGQAVFATGAGARQ